jgi:hypothetical protein
MALTFQGGQALPAQGSAAYNAAASPNASGAGAYNASSGVLSSSNNSASYSPTVITNANTYEQTIPNTVATANSNIASVGGGNPNTGNTGAGGASGGATGANTGAYGLDPNSPTYYSDYLKAETNNQEQSLINDPIYQADLNLIKSAGANADAATQASLAALQGQYQSQYAATVQTQQSTTAGLEQSLNLGGSTRYAPISSAGILDSKARYDLQTLTDLGNANASNVAKLNQAIADNDFKTAQSINDEMSKTRTQAQTIAQGLVNNAMSLAKDARDKLTAAQTDASSTALKNGAPQSVIDAINNAKTPADAYAAASGYGGGANIDVQKITNVDGSSSIVRVDKNTGKIIGTTNIGGVDPSVANNSPLSPTDYKDFITGLTPEGASNFNKLSPTDQSNVKQLINGDVLLSDLFASRGVAGSTLRQQALMKAQSVDPTFSENTNKIRYNFMQNWTNDATKGNVGVRTAINTGLGHLADLKTNTDALDKEALTTINKVSNWWNAQTSNSSLLKAQTDISALAGEVAKAYNEDTVSGIDKWTSVLGVDYAKGGITAVENEISKLLTSKITSLRYTYKTAMGKDLNQSVIDPDKKQALLDAGIDPANIAHENLPGQAKTGVAGQIDTALGSTNPATGQKYTAKDIVDHLKTDPKYATEINSVLGKADASGHIITEQDIVDFLHNQ